MAEIMIAANGPAESCSCEGKDKDWSLHWLWSCSAWVILRSLMNVLNINKPSVLQFHFQRILLQHEFKSLSQQFCLSPSVGMDRSLPKESTLLCFFLVSILGSIILIPPKRLGLSVEWQCMQMQRMVAPSNLLHICFKSLVFWVLYCWNMYYLW